MFSIMLYLGLIYFSEMQSYIRYLGRACLNIVITIWMLIS